MSSPGLPDDVTRALADFGLRPTGALGPSGGWVAAEAAGGLVELVVRGGAPDGASTQALTDVRHTHLVPVHAVLPMPGDRTGLLVGVGPELSLAAVRQARVPLTDGEAATVAIPLAEALDALHAAGLAYGRMDCGDMLLAGDGMPVLAAPAQPFGPSEHDVKHLLTALLGVMAPRTVALTTWGRDDWDDGAGLREAFEALLAAGCRSGDEVIRACLETVRPEAIRIPADAMAYRGRPEPAVPLAAPAVPSPAGPLRRSTVGPARPDGPPARASVRLPRRTPPTAPAAPDRRRPSTVAGRAGARRSARRRRRVGGGVLAALAIGLVVAVLVRPSGAAEAGAAPSGADGTVGVVGSAASPGDLDPVLDRSDPVAAAAALTRLRAAALASGSPAALDAVDVAGGPARDDDGRLLASLDGSTIEGLAADVQRVESVGPRPEPREDEATVLVTAAMSPYTLAGTDGSRTDVPGTAPSTAALTLRWTDDGWRVWSVSGATGT